MGLLIGSIVVALIIAWAASKIGVFGVFVCGILTMFIPPLGVIVTIIWLIVGGTRVRSKSSR